MHKCNLLIVGLTKLCVMSETPESQVQNVFETIAKVRTSCEQQQELLSAFFWGITPDGPIPPLIPNEAPIEDKTRHVMLLMLSGILISCNTILKLSKEPDVQTKDCYIIARSVVEALVNLSYIIAEGEEVADKALRHFQQKAYRDMDRTSQIADSIISIKCQGMPNIEDMPDMEEMIEEFTSRSGREKGWTDLSIDQRIEKIGGILEDKQVTLLHAARFMIYRHASEIIHGTLFGTAYFLGLADPKGVQKTVEDGKIFVLNHLKPIFLCIQIAISVFMKCVDYRYGFPRFAKASDILLVDMLEIILNKKANDA